ncbi:hypothetical protein V8F20_008111 [Naviculisporaceae sp. PSN 640]
MVRVATLFMAGLAVLANGLEAPIPGYTVQDFVWEVEPWNNGTLVNITGPVEHVYDTLKKLNPDSVKNISITGTPDSPNAVEFGDIKCGALTWNWGAASYYRIWEGVQYLKGVPGKPAASPGPGSCGRVSCSWKSAIWWCNDKKTENILPGFYSIADCAWELCQKCKENTSGEPGDDYCRGQHFVNKDWNCIVRYDGDKC